MKNWWRFFFKSSWKTQAGMTLLEIMIVLAILALIASVVGPSVLGQLEKAKIKEAKIQISELQKAVDLFYTDCGSYPKDLDELLNPPSECPNWGPDPYIKKIPKDPWNEEFYYEVDGGSYEIFSFGEDKKEGGTGKAKDLSSNDL